jgi:hypothetical protein
VAAADLLEQFHNRAHAAHAATQGDDFAKPVLRLRGLDAGST